MTAYADLSDQQKQIACGKMFEVGFNCRVHHFAQLDPVDWWIEYAGPINGPREPKNVGVAEHKWRNYNKDDFATTYLRLTKWWSLRHAVAFGGARAGLFVVEFLDGPFYVNIDRVESPQVHLGVGGRTDRPERGDWDKYQPVIEVPVDMLEPVCAEDVWKRIRAEAEEAATMSKALAR